MRRIDLDTPTTSPARPRLRRRLAFTLAGALAMGAAAVALMQHGQLQNGQTQHGQAQHGQTQHGQAQHGQSGTGPLSSAELASWTSTPTPVDPSTDLGATTRKWCLDRMTDAPGAGEPVTITNADFRGKVTSMIVNRGGNAMLCYVASDTSGLWETIDPAKPVAADAITYDTGGSHGNGAATFNYAEGSAGADVKAITMQNGGRTFQITVQNGRWTAWWPGSDGQAGVPGTVTLTLTGGTTRTVSGASLLPN